MENTFEHLPKAVSLLQESVNEIKRLLLEKSTQPPLKSNKPLTAKDAAEFLKLSIPTIRTRCRKKNLPHYKEGKILYFDEKELWEHIRSGKRKTNSEINAERDAFIGASKIKGGTRVK